MKELLQQVLYALEIGKDYADTRRTDEIDYAITALREALAAPPAAPAVPLTDEQIDELWRAPMSADWEHREFARAIEKAHGIGGGNG